MTTITEHAAAVARAIEVAARAVPSRDRRVDAVAVARNPTRYLARVLASDLRAALDVPLFDNSQMDGFAVRSAELARATEHEPARLPVGPPIAAGDPLGDLPEGTARPIMTGAPIPRGADAVVPIERTDPGSFDAATVSFTAPVERGTFVRRRAIDVAAGDVIARAGDPLRLAQLGACAAAGVARVSLRRRLRVLVVTTGQELVEPCSTPIDARTTGTGGGRVPDAIGGMLAAAIRSAGAHPQTVRCPSDDPAEFQAVISSRLDWADLVVTVGGVSKGAYEVVRLALGPQGVSFTHVAMQPGGPQGIGTLRHAGRSVPVVCFPGNPVSALISFEVFLRPGLRRSAGLTPVARHSFRALLAAPLDSKAHQHQLRRGALRSDGRVEPIGGPGSHLIAHYGAANVIIHVPVGVTRLEAGEEAEVWQIDD